LTLLLLYAKCVGIVCSRTIERADYEDLAFRVLTANQQPDHSLTNAQRKAIVEPVNGEWHRIAATHNLPKWFRLSRLKKVCAGRISQKALRIRWHQLRHRQAGLNDGAG
jgi:hypothetical protein